jgi:hypothetical protein
MLLKLDRMKALSAPELKRCRGFVCKLFSAVSKFLDQKLVSIPARIRSQGSALLNPKRVLWAVVSLPAREVYATTTDLKRKLVSGEHQPLLCGRRLQALNSLLEGNECNKSTEMMFLAAMPLHAFVRSLGGLSPSSG